MDCLPSVCIVILNFNGCSDTIECLSSVSGLDYENFYVIVIDNCSIDNSIEKIIKWSENKYLVEIINNDVHRKPINEHHFHFGKRKSDQNLPELLMIENSANVGFAAGCNIGIQIALANGSEYVWLLNNDTIVNTDSLSVLSQYLSKHYSCQIATPQIRLYDKPDRIWNCGGRLEWYGARKYFFVNKPVAELPDKEVIDISFVTGCAPLIRNSLLQSLGGFTEKYFFGEEDFEFCLRAKKVRAEMVCCLQSIIYHKVGSSIDKSSGEGNIGKTYIYYLNRFIDLRNYMPRLFWHGWRMIYVVYVFFLLWRQSDYGFMIRFGFIRKLLHDSTVFDGVDKDTFHKILDSNVGYFQ